MSPRNSSAVLSVLILTIFLAAAGPSATAEMISVPAAADAGTYRINDAGLEIIKDAEGLRLTAYEETGTLRIGYGRAVEPGGPTTITETEAAAYLREDVRAVEAEVATALTRPVTANQFSAMVSLAYNIGTGAFRRSSIVRKFNAGDMAGAGDAFLLYVKAGGVVNEQLKSRREQERALYFSAI